MEYLVQGQLRKWHGYLISKDIPSLTEALQNQLQLLEKSQFFTLTAEAFTTSELSLLNGQHPQNLDILKHLVERLVSEDSHQIASAQIEQMISLSQELGHPLYEAYGYWLKGRVLHNLQQYELAIHNLNLAREKVAEVEFYALQSEISKSLADIALVDKDFKKIQEHLYLAASHARLANRPVQEIRAYTLLSIMASKLGLNEERYEFLYQAKTLLADYALDASHYMLVFYHFALFADTTEERQTSYLKVLEQPVTPENYWVFFSVSEQLSQLYGQQDKWQEAFSLADKVHEPARQAFLRAKINLAQGNKESAAEQALISFNSARTQRIDWIGLDMALILLELRNQQADNGDILLYKRYIENHAASWWLERHKLRLETAGFILDPYLLQDNQQ